MSEGKAIEELEAALTRDEQRLREIERIEEALLQDIPLVGFRTGIQEVRLRSEKEMLSEMIYKNRQLLVVAQRGSAPQE
jgi:hypothetical protein